MDTIVGSSSNISNTHREREKKKESEKERDFNRYHHHKTIQQHIHIM